MKRIIPFDAAGDQCGPAIKVPDQQWETMQKTFGSKIRWRQSDKAPKKETEIKLKPVKAEPAKRKPRKTKSVKSKVKKDEK